MSRSRLTTRVSAPPSRIVQPAAGGGSTPNAPTNTGLLSIINPIRLPPVFRHSNFAPAWLYSALNFLNKFFFDGSNVRQRFNGYIVGSDVDPYSGIGSTRLFIIVYGDGFYSLTIAPDTNSVASAQLSSGTTYSTDDAGILDMYNALAASSIFSAVNYVYLPARLSPGLDPNVNDRNGQTSSMPLGYDPVTGLRSCVLGSAVAQVVPLNQFLQASNQQIYNPQPTIVPFATALVYDITTNNALNAKTFVLPTLYSPDMIATGRYYVNHYASVNENDEGNQVSSGQTVLFPGGPGFDNSVATSLTLDSTTYTNVGGFTVLTYNFNEATVTSSAVYPVLPRAQIGVTSLTYTGTPSTVFAGQNIMGFYRPTDWSTARGVPLFDYEQNNASFSSGGLSSDLSDPEVVYDPTTPFLNGGSLQNVLRKLAQATYLYAPDRLVEILNDAATEPNTDSNTTGAGLSVTTAALDFQFSSPPAAPILDHLTVPVLATVITTPLRVVFPPGGRTLEAGSGGLVPIGIDNNLPTFYQPTQSTVQLGLNASIPQEALVGTGITSIEQSTIFPPQQLGQGAALVQLATPGNGVVVNLMQGNSDIPNLPPYYLDIANTGASFQIGLYYVLSLTDSALTIRAPDGSLENVYVDAAAPRGHTYVGAMIYSDALTSVTLFGKLPLLLAAPAVGTHGVVQGALYSVRLTVGDGHCAFDVSDSTNTVLDTNIEVPNPTPSPGSRLLNRDLYFGSFIGGSLEMTVWSVPVFLTVGPTQLVGASFAGSMVLEAEVSGLPSYQLQITDYSLYVFSNINVDTYEIGSVSSANVFLSSAVINSSPDDLSAEAFAPCKLLLGLIRQARVGPNNPFVFVPEDDSVIIGGVRYMLSVIYIDAPALPDATYPYPPTEWASSQFWQFANRHNPFLDVAYEGDNENQRISRAQADTVRIGLQTARAQEPMQMYLDTDRTKMTVNPIVEFPYSTSTGTIDIGRLQTVSSAILSLLQNVPEKPVLVTGGLDAELVTIPSALQTENPWKAQTTAPSDSSTSTSSGDVSTTTSVAPVTLSGLQVTNLAPTSLNPVLAKTAPELQNLQARQVQETAAAVQASKYFASTPSVTQVHSTFSETAIIARRSFLYFAIFGFSVYNPSTGEAYIVSIVDADRALPNKLPDPTLNVTYDPFYVRVVFLNTLTSYNMSIIVPSMVYDSHGYLAQPATSYDNVISKTDELKLGYMYSLYSANSNFDSLSFNPYPPSVLHFPIGILSGSSAGATPPPGVFTNLPYSTEQSVIFNPISLFQDTPILNNDFEGKVDDLAQRSFNIPISSIRYRPATTPLAYFACRRQNWNSECHLMQATHTDGTAAYLSFGAGDIVPLSLNAGAPQIDRRNPSHMHMFLQTLSDKNYIATRTVTVSNTPYIVCVASDFFSSATFSSVSIGTDVTGSTSLSNRVNLQFPSECYVVGQASTTLTSLGNFDSSEFTTTINGTTVPAVFELVTTNNLVYLIRAVANNTDLGTIGGLGVVSGLLIDTFVPSVLGNLQLAQAARYKRSGLSFFGASYTPGTLVDSIDNLDYTSITGETFYAPTIFIPIPELDATRGIVVDLSSFHGQQIWTIIYPEIVAQADTEVNGVKYSESLNLDGDGKPILKLQKLHFVYDPLVVMYTPNDLAHKYPLQAKEAVLALTNDQIREGICWRSANVESDFEPPTNICAQEILPEGIGMDRVNIIYSPLNRPVVTSTGDTNYMGMSVNSIVSISGAAYNIEESAMIQDQTGSNLVSTVSSISNMLLGVVFDYDNNDWATYPSADNSVTTKGLVFLNGYLGANGYVFSSPDHMDVNDIQRSQVPLLEQIATILGSDVAYNNTDLSLPRQFWTLSKDVVTAPGLPNYIPDAAPPPVDPTFSNRTRSLLLSLENTVQPSQIGILDTYNSVVSANLHLDNGVTGSIFVSKKAERDIASIGTSDNTSSISICGLPSNMDFFIFSRDHYGILKNATVNIIDQGYAMCLIDDGSGTGTKVAKYYIDSDGNYFELYSMVISSTSTGVLESSTFILKVTLGAPANLSATPIIPETPNNVNPQDLVTQINANSALVYAAMGPANPGQPPPFLPIQCTNSSTGGPTASPITDPPGFNGYSINVVSANRQPVQIAEIFSGTVQYPIAGSTTLIPLDTRTGRGLPFYGSLSHGLDRLQPPSVALISPVETSLQIPLTGVISSSTPGLGGNGLGALIEISSLSTCFQGVAPIPSVASGDISAGSTMKGDDGIFYTFNAVTSIVMDSAGRQAEVIGGQYFVDTTDPSNPIYAVITTPSFLLNGILYSVNINTTAMDGVTSQYTLTVGQRSFPFDGDNIHVTVDGTQFTFNQATGGGAFTVTYASLDAPQSVDAPTPILLTPFSITAGGGSPGGTVVDVFRAPQSLEDMLLGVIDRTYTYDLVHARVTINQAGTATTVSVKTGSVFTSYSGYGYVVGFNSDHEGYYTINGAPMIPYSAWLFGSGASYSLMTRPQMFTVGSNFYTFDRDSFGNYVSVSGNGQIYPVNPYQFSLNGSIYIINTLTQPNTVLGGGNTYTMTSSNTQFVINGVQYTIALRQNSLSGATISGQFNIAQGNVIVIENYVYQLDTINGQIVGNGTAYPLTTSGLTYTIQSTDNSFTVTSAPNATTVTIGNIVYEINNTTVVGDGVIYPILPYRTFRDDGQTFNIELDGTVSIAPPFTLSTTDPPTFTDGVQYFVNDIAAFDGTYHYLISGLLPQFSAGGLTYSLRTDGVSIAAGPSKTHLVRTSGALNPTQFTFGSSTIFYGRQQDIAAFDGVQYYAISNNQFTDTTTNKSYTLSGNTAVNAGNSYEIFSNLGQGAYFQVPDGPTYYVNVLVADTGSATGNLGNVFPISGGQFTIPMTYTIKVTGSTVTVSSITFAAASVSTLTAFGGSLSGGYFTDPVTEITYTCVNNGTNTKFIDSNNTVYPYPSPGTPNGFVAEISVSTGLTFAVSSATPPQIYPVVNNQFIVNSTTYAIYVPVAYTNATTGPYWPMINGRFIVPRTEPLSSIAYTVRGTTVTKGFVISGDDEFSIHGDVIYTINAVNVVKTTDEASISGTEPNQTLQAGASTYQLNTSTSLATTKPAGLKYDATAKQFTVSYNGLFVTYLVQSTGVADNRIPSTTFPSTLSGTQISFRDTVSDVIFMFDSSGNNPITVSFVYENDFFIDSIAGSTFYVDMADSVVETISYLSETTQYAFSPADGQTYIIHYSDVGVIFPVITGSNVNVGVATIGSDEAFVHVSEVDNVNNGTPNYANKISFEINGNLYTIVGQGNNGDYSACSVVGGLMPPKLFTTATKFSLTDTRVVYTLNLDSRNSPVSISADFIVRSSQNLLSINDDVYILTYNSVSTGSLQGQGRRSIVIANSKFVLTNPFDTTKAQFIFADLNIYDAASVVGQFSAYFSPTFVLGSATYTLDSVNMVVKDNNKRPFPLIANPTMFSINGANYVIDSNRVPHAIVGNTNVSPLATDVTIQNGKPVPNSTFTLNGQIYKYTEDMFHNLLTITGTRIYVVSQPALTFKLDSSLVFTISTASVMAGSFPGTVIPIGSITAGAATTPSINIYRGVPESGNSDFFLYKNVMYTLTKSNGVYTAIQKSYTVYVASPSHNQQQLAVFDLAGKTYMVTDGATAGTSNPPGINPGTIWAATAVTANETQFGLVYGFSTQPTNVSIGVTSTGSKIFQFQIKEASGKTSLYDIDYALNSNANVVKLDTPNSLPTFVQFWNFDFVTSYPLTFETGGYNAFTQFVSSESPPLQSFSAAFTTSVFSSDPALDGLMTARGDFTVEFWHSIPATTPQPSGYHPFSYAASTATSTASSSTVTLPVTSIDVDFENATDIYVTINKTMMKTTTVPPVFSSRWRHFALAYTQPYTMMCLGSGFEVDQAAKYNFTRDFSIVTTFSVSTIEGTQGLLYKGTGGDSTAPELTYSYRVTLVEGAVTLTFTDGNGNPSPIFTGPTITAQQLYRLFIIKSTNTTAAVQNQSLDPYAPPFDVKDFGSMMKSGATASGGDSNGNVTLTNIMPETTTPNSVSTFLTNIQNTTSFAKSYSISIYVQTSNDNGEYGALMPDPSLPKDPNLTQTVKADQGLLIQSSGSSNLLIGRAFDDQGQYISLGGSGQVGNIRDMFLFSSAINPTGINSNAGVVDVNSAATTDLIQAGALAYWKASYDVNNVVSNLIDPDAVAISSNVGYANLAPLSGFELEGATLYLNGYAMTLQLYKSGSDGVTWPTFPSGSSLNINAGQNDISEISVWNMSRQQYQILDDMFGRLNTPQPSLALYLSGSFPAPSTSPLLPMRKFIDNVQIVNEGGSLALTIQNASKTLSGCPAVGRCGPLITPNLYTPPGDALTLCDTVPCLTTFSSTSNDVTSTLAGSISEAYVYISNSVLTVYGGKKVGDLVLSWISQEQGDVQVIGYIEGAPPCPMANLTNKTSYAGATSLTLTVPTSVTLKYSNNTDNSKDLTSKWAYKGGGKFDIGFILAPFGGGMEAGKGEGVNLETTLGPTVTSTTTTGMGTAISSSDKLEESNKFTVKMQGSQSVRTGDLFMSSINAATTPGAAAGTPSTRHAILPNPQLGGFTSSNPPGELPKSRLTEEKFGQPMYTPSPYGQAFVTSQTLDVYSQTLVQSNTVYGFVRVPNTQIPRDINIVSFRMSSNYLRPGCLDGVIGYAYNPATLPDGTQTYTTSTGQMNVLYDKNFSAGDVGHDASYMKVVEAYQLKKTIDQEALNSFALYQTAYNNTSDPSDPSLTPGLDFYNESIWSSRGGAQEVKHTYTTTFDEVYTTNSGSTSDNDWTFNIKLTAGGITVVDYTNTSTEVDKSTLKYSYDTTGTTSFDLTTSLDGIESDTQMRYASANDAHFVMNNNSMYNPNNQSGLNLVISSDGLVYNLVPSVASGAGAPTSDNIDDSQTYSQPQPVYSRGNASGLTGNLEPYARPGKTDLFRMYTFFLQPTDDNADAFWNTVVDPVWLANSPEADAVALRTSQTNKSVPWRVLYRVTYSERTPPPISGISTVTPQITPIMAVPVLDPPSHFLFTDPANVPQGSLNPGNDIEANVVLCAPSSTGQSVGTTSAAAGAPVVPNNVIPFDFPVSAASLVNWGDSANSKILRQLISSVLGVNTIHLVGSVPPGSTKTLDVMDPVQGGVLYSIYTDPNGMTINVAANPAISIYQDVNSNPVQYYDGQNYHSLQSDYIASPDGTVMYYIEPPSTYDQTTFDLLGDYDLYGNPGDQWRYYLVSGFSSNLTSSDTIAGSVEPFFSSAGGYTGFSVATAQHVPASQPPVRQVAGYVLCRAVMTWPHLNTKAEPSADVAVYKALSLLDTFPLGDVATLIKFLETSFPNASWITYDSTTQTTVVNEDIANVFAKNIVSFFNATQGTLMG